MVNITGRIEEDKMKQQDKYQILEKKFGKSGAKPVWIGTKGEKVVHWRRIEPTVAKGFEDVDIRYLVDKNTMGSKELAFMRTVFGPHSGAHVKHVHGNAEEVEYVIKGRAFAGVGNMEYEVGPGDVIFVPKGIPHWFRNPFEEKVEIVCVYSAPSLKESEYKIVP